MQTPEISHEMVGGILLADAAGLYPGLELLNYIYGCPTDILSDADAPTFVRVGHDFARRLVWDQDRFAADNMGSDAFVGEDASAVLAALLKCLQLPVPDRKSANWEAAHFFPYTRSLIHWDARTRRSSARDSVRVERRYLRGGGALAHRVLRSDPDRDRRETIRVGFRELMPDDASTPLDSLASVLSRYGAKTDAQVDPIEQQASPREDALDGNFRNGIRSILSHTDLSSTARVKAIMNWTGFWLAICQKNRSAGRLGTEPTSIVIDCGTGPGQLRRESARALKEIVATIVTAAQDCLPEDELLKTKSRQDLQGFFTRTCAWIGMLNAFTGRRYFVIGLDLVEALTLAHVQADAEISFENFTRVLYDNYGLVFGREAAARTGALNRLDASIFEDNEAAFATQLLTAGLMHAYSDATRMVGTGALK
ncbi:hypothetical protein [Mycobacterium sp. M23085]|uniref:hypothetical protein n=1 Tax=Mycobacterium sp. M23085 TaxID=3378087 RepID=UPI003877E66E